MTPKHWALRAAAIAAVAVVAGASRPSLAVTLTIDGSGTPYVENGFQIDPIRIVDGNCDGASGKPCMAFSTNDTSTLTKTDAGTFALNDFGFEFQGKPSTLKVESFSGASLVDTVTITDVKNTWFLFSAYHGALSNITSIVFTDSGDGNLRIDDLDVSFITRGDQAGTAPLPAALPMFMAGAGAIGLLARRRKRKRAA